MTTPTTPQTAEEYAARQEAREKQVAAETAELAKSLPTVPDNPQTFEEQRAARAVQVLAESVARAHLAEDEDGDRILRPIDPTFAPTALAQGMTPPIVLVHDTRSAAAANKAAGKDAQTVAAGDSVAGGDLTQSSGGLIGAVQVPLGDLHAAARAAGPVLLGTVDKSGPAPVSEGTFPGQTVGGPAVSDEQLGQLATELREQLGDKVLVDADELADLKARVAALEAPAESTPTDVAPAEPDAPERTSERSPAADQAPAKK